MGGGGVEELSRGAGKEALGGRRGVNLKMAITNSEIIIPSYSGGVLLTVGKAKVGSETK